MVAGTAVVRDSPLRIFRDHEPPWTLESSNSRPELSVPAQCCLLFVVVRPPGSDEIAAGYLCVLLVINKVGDDDFFSLVFPERCRAALVSSIWGKAGIACGKSSCLRAISDFLRSPWYLLLDAPW